MKIIAKKGTALENTIKEMCEKLTQGIVGAQMLVEKATGIKPVNVFHLYHWGTISRPIAEFDIHPDDIAKINPHILRKQKGSKSIYVPAKRYKEGRELADSFRTFANQHEITDEPLKRYGINMVDWKKGMSYSINLGHDKDNDRYMLICSDSIPCAFDKNIDTSQFDIEY